MADAREREIAAEQEYVDDLFERLDQEVAAANERLRQVQLEVDLSLIHI